MIFIPIRNLWYRFTDIMAYSRFAPVIQSIIFVFVVVGMITLVLMIIGSTEIADYKYYDVKEYHGKEHTRAAVCDALADDKVTNKELSRIRRINRDHEMTKLRSICKEE